jgi:hypothetical protein
VGRLTFFIALPLTDSSKLSGHDTQLAYPCSGDRRHRRRRLRGHSAHELGVRHRDLHGCLPRCDLHHLPASACAGDRRRRGGSGSGPGVRARYVGDEEANERREGPRPRDFLERNRRIRYALVEPTLRHAVLMQSLVSIRAFGLEDHVRSENICCTDRYSRAARTFNTVDKWASVRMDAIGTVFILGLTTYLVYGPQGANPSEIGFSLDMAFGFARLILWLVINVNETQSTSENCDEGRR